ncbi:hypothetical protein C0J52_21320 [Blattella germanica]|nr:hypothetical protein C0J52_21320 [Blattella germanica]
MFMAIFHCECSIIINMPRYRRCSVVACKNRRIPTEEKVFTFPYIKEIAEEWVRFSNNPDLRLEDAHLYAKRGRVMCHRHFTSAQFTTPKRLRLNRGAVPTIQNSNDELYDAPPQGVSPTFEFTEKDSSAADNREIENCGSNGNTEKADTLQRVNDEKALSENAQAQPIKEENEEETENFTSREDGESMEIPVKVELHQVDEPEEPLQSENVSPT